MVMYTLLYLKWITNKDLLYSTWNSCSVLYGSLDGRRVWGIMDTCIHMVESLHCSPETITTLLISYTSIGNKGLKKRKETFPLKFSGCPVVRTLYSFFFFFFRTLYSYCQGPRFNP